MRTEDIKARTFVALENHEVVQLFNDNSYYPYVEEFIRKRFRLVRRFGRDGKAIGDKNTVTACAIPSHSIIGWAKDYNPKEIAMFNAEIEYTKEEKDFSELVDDMTPDNRKIFAFDPYLAYLDSRKFTFAVKEE